jgi:hypothetical protein
MESAHLSAIIECACKKCGINYTSSNPHYVKIAEDACKLADIYKDLKIMLGTLQEIEENHNLNPQIVDRLESAIKELYKADHVIIKVAKELAENINDNLPKI